MAENNVEQLQCTESTSVQIIKILVKFSEKHMPLTRLAIIRLGWILAIMALGFSSLAVAFAIIIIHRYISTL